MWFRSFEHNQVYHPSRTLQARPSDLGRPCEDVYFTSADGLRLHGWFFPANTNSARAKYVLLFCHGNGGNISHRLDVYDALLETGVNVFAFDYRGYGLSEGKPGEEGTYLDAHAAAAWLRERGFAAENIIPYGESLGGGIASELAETEPTAGLILQSTFTSIPDIGAEVYPWLPVKLLCSIRYNTQGRLPKITVPVLIMHSRADGLVAYRHSERNFAAANEPKLFWNIQGDHNDALMDRAGFIEGIERFLQMIEARQAERAEGP